MPLLFKIVTSIYRKDLVRNVFREDHSKVCRPCFRRLDRVTKLDRELQEKQAELTQQVKHLRDRVLSVTDSSTAAISASVAQAGDRYSNKKTSTIHRPRKTFTREAC